MRVKWRKIFEFYEIWNIFGKLDFVLSGMVNGQFDNLLFLDCSIISREKYCINKNMTENISDNSN